MTQPRTPRLLLVDDDAVDRMTVRRLLRQGQMEAEVTECADAASAARLVAGGGIDCVLLDYNLPGTDGVAALQQLRAAGDVPVISLTGQGDEEVAVELMKAGALDYLNKNTLTAERLTSSLRYVMRIHQAAVERARLVEREQQALREAQAANRAKDEFLATLSHELRTPLNAILGWSRLLLTGQLDEPTTRRAVEIIERNTRLQAQLIEDLLDISRIITGKLHLDARPVFVRSVVEAAVESVAPAADAKGVTIGREYEHLDQAFICDPSRMQQIIWNLLSNALKFTPEGGRIAVKVSRTARAVRIDVTDTGIGIEPGFLPYVFERFRQQDGATTRAHGGLGLGLSIVKHLVELHGGSVSAHSEGPNRGATFTVTVPAAQIPPAVGESRRAVSAQPLGALPSLDGLTVLVVDDEADARALVATVLERCGARVMLADSVRAAVEQIGAACPDVLLSDIAMPGEDGYELIRRIRTTAGATRHLPAAALTAFATPADRTRILLAGYQTHLPKPVDPSELAVVVASLAGRTAVGS